MAQMNAIGYNILNENDFASNSANALATQASIRAYILDKVAGKIDYQSGGYNASTNSPDLDTSPSGILDGYAYIVTAAGNFFDRAVEVGDTLISMQDNPTTIAHWAFVGRDRDLATTTTVGVVELATAAEVDTGTDDTRAITPDALEGSALQSKVNGIEASADVTDATNVAAAGAVMESDATTASMSFVVDEDNMASDSATKVPTQQSAKAYVDGKVWAKVEVTGTTQEISGTTDTIYIINNAALCTLTFPATVTLGRGWEFIGKGAGGYKIAQLANQQVLSILGDSAEGTGGYLQGTQKMATKLRCITANTIMQVVSAMGNHTIA
ncbi:MAG: hypothetical protein HN929_10275 [Chloroflexi bacterium]|jgi:hypothetical protein|nr:hypothetical protein [Chloroflexota bacterium]